MRSTLIKNMFNKFKFYKLEMLCGNNIFIYKSSLFIFLIKTYILKYIFIKINIIIYCKPKKKNIRSQKKIKLSPGPQKS